MSLSLLARVCIGDLAAADLEESSTASWSRWCARDARKAGEAHVRRRSELPGSVLMFQREDRWSSCAELSSWSIKGNMCSRCEVPRRVATVK
jgi:hypothetical protein